MRGERFPDPRELHLDIEPMQVNWQYRGEANEQRTSTLAYIRVGDPAPKLAAAEADTLGLRRAFATQSGRVPA